jgi:hypothetical protein
MKNAILILLTFFTISCNKSEVVETKPATVYEATGTITGQDMSLCACCGGWIITIDNFVQSTMNPPIRHRFYNLPASSTINLATATLPLNVKFNWTDSNICGGQNGVIIIDEIELN